MFQTIIGYVLGEPVYVLRGGDSGFSTQGDVLVNETADGVDLNTIWSDVAAALSIYNTERSTIASILSYRTTNTADAVPQSISYDSFEEASEFGVPTAMRESPDVLLMGYDFKDYDKATRFTWKFLRDATAEQVNSVVNRVLEADNRRVTGKILDRLFNPAERANEFGAKVFGLWTGTDGLGPLPYLGKEFPTSTNHYLPTGGALIDSGDVEGAIKLITDKGYGRQPGTQLLILANPQEGELIQTWKAGETNNNSQIAKHDFVRSATAPAYLTQDNIVGKVPPGEYNGLPVEGSYGPAWLIQSEFIPAGWFTVVASGGPNSTLNPVAMREHAKPQYQGLRLLAGKQPGYPLQESFFARGFGTGVRFRGAAVCVQVTTNASYTAPVIAM
ncbi:hypothetical protein ACFVH4_30095 [Nocardia ignorata]|uniref:hypothetical protein n=1 Tax=Nocardia ignorata TaxID=145285 RepID=UPI003628B3B1